jgi:hypothetical protein
LPVFRDVEVRGRCERGIVVGTVAILTPWPHHPTLKTTHLESL